MAQVAFLMEDYGAMASSCEKALLISQDNPEIYYLYGRACLGQEDLTNALAMYTKAISINENYADAYLMRANVLLEKGEVEDADKDSEWLMERAPEVEDVLLLKAKVEMAKGELAKALSFYNKVIEQNPFSIDGYSERAKLKMQMDDQQGAAEDLAKLKDINPDTMDENLDDTDSGIIVDVETGEVVSKDKNGNIVEYSRIEYPGGRSSNWRAEISVKTTRMEAIDPRTGKRVRHNKD